MKNQTFSPTTEPEPHRKPSFKFLFAAALLLFVLSLFLIFSEDSSQTPKQISSGTPDTQDSLEALLYTQLPGALEEIDSEYLTIDDILFSDDKSQAVLWMASKEDVSGELLAREPQIILAIWDEETGEWKLHLPEDDDFNEYLQTSFFKDSELAERFREDDSKASSGKTYGGYYLPWEAGLTKRLTWSVGHTSCASGYCRYAFDFADGTMFDLLAAKGGYVYHWRDDCKNGYSSCTNSITLEDRSTTPWTYQIYLHIANNSIPASLKQKGVYVMGGQKIANVDDTGYSTGHHVHFMVVEQTTLNTCPKYCFGKSVDITFKDVPINWDPATQGGRPRLAGEASWYGGVGQTKYVSGNILRKGEDPVFNYILFPIFNNYPK